jgi:hypothetical protein
VYFLLPNCFLQDFRYCWNKLNVVCHDLAKGVLVAVLQPSGEGMPDAEPDLNESHGCHVTDPPVSHRNLPDCREFGMCLGGGQYVQIKQQSRSDHKSPLTQPARPMVWA